MRGRDLTGQVFFDLTVLSATGERKFGNRVWECRCTCGKVVPAQANNLKTGNTKSCGCRNSRVITARNIARTKHGHAKTYKASPTYRSWSGMISRCESPSSDQYKNYGARGIRVCARWRDSFKDFLADMGERPEGKTIDRKNPDGDYSPDNCRWATAKEQCANKRNNVKLVLNGNNMTIAQWAEALGCGVTALHARLADGWSVEKTLSTPIKKYRPRS